MIRAFRMLIGMMILTGVIYPLCMTGLARLILPKKAQGSMIIRQGEIIGSELIGQEFSQPHYFWSRPSATLYSAMPGAGSNLGPTSAKLQKLVEGRKKAFGDSINEVPSDLLYASGSGLDPHITPQAAYFQIERIAKARKATPDQIESLIEKNIQQRLSSPCVNVLKLNIALDQMEQGKS